MAIKHAEILLDLRIGFPNTNKFVFSLARLAKDTSQLEFRREMDFLNKCDSPKHVLEKISDGLKSSKGVT